MQDTVSNATPRTYSKVVLVQAEGGQAKMILEVTITTTSNIKLTSDNLCTRKNLIYQNKYDSGVWAQRCLEVNHKVGESTGSSEAAVALRSYLSTKNLKFPDTNIFLNWHEYDQHGQNWQVRLDVNPTAFGFLELQTNWTNSPWNRDLILKDPVRSNFMTDFINFAQQYGNALHGSFIGGVAGPTPSFSPQGNSLPRQDTSTSGTTSNNPNANYQAKCVAIGFKINTSALEDCVKELKSRER